MKRFFVSALFLCQFFLSSAFAKTTTVLIYWAVDNDLYQFSIPYLEQFKALNDYEGLNMLLEYDYPDSRPTKRFHNFKFLEEIGEKNSADYRTLSAFINRGITLFPADETILIIGSHGANWDGIIEDATSKKWMSLAGMSKAFEENVPLLPQKKFDMVIFDACRMSFVETLFMLGEHTKLLLGSAFDVNGFNHKDPLLAHISTGRSMVETGQDYARAYSAFKGNREYMDMGASLLRAEENMDVLPLSKLFSALGAKDDDELAPFVRSLFRDGAISEDWGLDLLELIRRSGETFAELQMDALMLLTTYSPRVLESSVTPRTRPHGGIGLTCASDIRKYRKFELHQVLPEWTELCARMRKIY